MDPEQRGGDRSGSGWIRLCGSVGILTVAVGSASVLLAAPAVGSPVPPRTAGQSVDAGAQTPAPSHDGHAELMKRLDAKDTSSAAVEALSKASGELLLCPLSEAAFTQLSAADQQKVYDRGAAFRALARSLAATIKQGGAAGDKAKALLKRLATDNSRSTLSKYAQAQGKFASDLLSK